MVLLYIYIYIYKRRDQRGRPIHNWQQRDLNLQPLCVCLRTKWLWVRIPLLSLKVQAIIECRLTLKRVRDMIAAYSLYIIVFFLDIKGSPQTRHLNKAPRLRTGTLWVYGDCYAFHFFETIENSTLCKKKFFVCNKYGIN